MNIGFSINQHDKDGYKYDDCVILHFNDIFLLRLSDVKQLEDVIEQLQNIKKEVVENYGL